MVPSKVTLVLSIQSQIENPLIENTGTTPVARRRRKRRKAVSEKLGSPEKPSFLPSPSSRLRLWASGTLLLVWIAFLLWLVITTRNTL